MCAWLRSRVLPFRLRINLETKASRKTCQSFSFVAARLNLIRRKPNTAYLTVVVSLDVEIRETPKSQPPSPLLPDARLVTHHLKVPDSRPS
ncbi:hypothetical protein Hypma_013670 [Hypsizygus marmoreus]|uniref:Uncharacterized protein n=1 Tax=Hypsizygus marmoreus TaxID=39966 RepID=A0A369JG22_HYPMA|nr:hypothetical protein Hypma_013670 [Hypsizygus marmoreus]